MDCYVRFPKLRTLLVLNQKLWLLISLLGTIIRGPNRVHLMQTVSKESKCVFKAGWVSHIEKPSRLLVLNQMLCLMISLLCTIFERTNLSYRMCLKGEGRRN